MPPDPATLLAIRRRAVCEQEQLGASWSFLIAAGLSAYQAVQKEFAFSFFGRRKVVTKAIALRIQGNSFFGLGRVGGHGEESREH